MDTTIHVGQRVRVVVAHAGTAPRLGTTGTVTAVYPGPGIVRPRVTVNGDDGVRFSVLAYQVRPADIYVARHLGEPRTWEGRTAARENVATVLAFRTDSTRIHARGRHALYGKLYRPQPVEARRPVERPAVEIARCA